jgi:hypothetical protein
MTNGGPQEYCDRPASVFDPKDIWNSAGRAGRDGSVLIPLECKKTSQHLKSSRMVHTVAHGNQPLARIRQCQDFLEGVKDIWCITVVATTGIRRIPV